MSGLDYIGSIIIKELYEGIRDQDGWETLEMSVRYDYPQMADLILDRLKNC